MYILNGYSTSIKPLTSFTVDFSIIVLHFTSHVTIKEQLHSDILNTEMISSSVVFLHVVSEVCGKENAAFIV